MTSEEMRKIAAELRQKALEIEDRKMAQVALTLKAASALSSLRKKVMPHVR